jgi:transposase
MTTPTPHSQSIYMREMMEHLGIEPGGGTISRLGLSYAAAFHRCEACPSKQACREWLDSMPAAVAFAPRFCPNADIFFELLVDEPGAWVRNLHS